MKFGKWCVVREGGIQEELVAEVSLRWIWCKYIICMCEITKKCIIKKSQPLYTHLGHLYLLSSLRHYASIFLWLSTLNFCSNIASPKALPATLSIIALHAVSPQFLKAFVPARYLFPVFLLHWNVSSVIKLTDSWLLDIPYGARGWTPGPV